MDPRDPSNPRVTQRLRERDPILRGSPVVVVHGFLVTWDVVPNGLETDFRLIPTIFVGILCYWFEESSVIDFCGDPLLFCDAWWNWVFWVQLMMFWVLWCSGVCGYGYCDVLGCSLVLEMITPVLTMCVCVCVGWDMFGLLWWWVFRLIVSDSCVFLI